MTRNEYVLRLVALEEIKAEPNRERQKVHLSELLENIRRDVERICGTRDPMDEQRRRDWDLKL